MKQTQHKNNRSFSPPWLLATLTLSFWLVGCGGAPTTTDLKELKRAYRSDSSQLKATRNAVQTNSAYQAHLKSGQGDALLIGARGATEIIKQRLPYPFKGREVMKKYLRGDFQITGVKHFEYLSGNRARLTLTFTGKNIKVSVPKQYRRFVSKKEIANLKKGLKRGEIDVVVTAYISTKKDALVLAPRAYDARLATNIGSRKGDLIKGINRKILVRKALPFEGSLKGWRSLLTTAHHLILMPK